MRVTLSPDSAHRISIAGGPMNVGKDLIHEAEPFKRAEHVGPKLNSGSDLAEFGRLFQHPDCHALARERIGRRQSADAAPSNQNRQLFTAPLAIAAPMGSHRHRGNTRGWPANGAASGEPAGTQTQDPLIKSSFAAVSEVSVRTQLYP